MIEPQEDLIVSWRLIDENQKMWTESVSIDIEKLLSQPNLSLALLQLVDTVRFSVYKKAGITE